MQGNDLTTFVGAVVGQIAPLVLGVVTGALITLGIVAGIVAFWPTNKE